MDAYKPKLDHPYGDYFPNHLLEVFQSPFPKKRIGQEGDGGYVIIELPPNQNNYDLLLGCGIADDLSFEYQLLELHPNLQAHVFDGSISKLPNKYDDHPRITFHRQFIGEDPFDINKRTPLSPIEELPFDDVETTIQNHITQNQTNQNHIKQNHINQKHTTQIKKGRFKYKKARLQQLEPVNIGAIPFDVNKIPKKLKTIKFFPQTTNLREHLELHQDIFLKMDIEGAEFDWFNSLSLDEIKKFKQIVIEIHKPFYPERYTTLENLRKTHYMVHLNGNNAFPPVKIGNQIFPKFIEATFLRKDLFPEVPPLSTEPIPSPLDEKNRQSRPWIVLKGYPYN